MGAHLGCTSAVSLGEQPWNGCLSPRQRGGGGERQAIAHSIDQALIPSDPGSIDMSARSGWVKVSAENDLPQPRRMGVQFINRLLERKRKVWELARKR